MKSLFALNYYPVSVYPAIYGCQRVKRCGRIKKKETKSAVYSLGANWKGCVDFGEIFLIVFMSRNTWAL